MQGATLNFDSTNVPVASPRDPVPADWYKAMLVASEMKPTSNNLGSMLSLEMDIVEGPYQGYKLYDRLNLQNQNAQAVEIAYKTLSAICHAVNVIQVANSAQLHNIPLMVKVSLRAARSETALDGSVKTYDVTNEVKGYKAIEAAAPGNFTPPPQQTFGMPGQAPQQGQQGAPAWQPPQQQAPAPQPPQAPAAGFTAPWQQPQTAPAPGTAAATAQPAYPGWQPQAYQGQPPQQPQQPQAPQQTFGMPGQAPQQPQFQPNPAAPGPTAAAPWMQGQPPAGAVPATPPWMQPK